MIQLINADNSGFTEIYAHLLLTDPPWGAGIQNKGTPYEFQDDPEDKTEVIAKVLGFASKCLVAIIACDDRWLPDYHLDFRAAGWVTRTLVCESQLGNPGLKRWPIKHYYWIICTRGQFPKTFNPDALPMEERRAKLGSGELKRVAGVLRTTISNTDPERVAGFQAQKPCWLLKALIETHTMPGDRVFDPYMGTGSTGVAAKDANRDFIGIEANAYTYAIANQRLRS